MKLTLVRTVNDVNFFNIRTAQISATMEGISLTYEDGHVEVRSKNFPGKVRWILPAAIAQLEWDEDE